MEAGLPLLSPEGTPPPPPPGARSWLHGWLRSKIIQGVPPALVCVLCLLVKKAA